MEVTEGYGGTWPMFPFGKRSAAVRKRVGHTYVTRASLIQQPANDGKKEMKAGACAASRRAGTPAHIYSSIPWAARRRSLHLVSVVAT